jgi:hypothetical protein
MTEIITAFVVIAVMALLLLLGLLNLIREEQKQLVLASRKNISVLNARTLTWDFNVPKGYKIDTITLEASPYQVTDVGISAGETLEGVFASFTGKTGGDLKINVKRNGFAVAALTSWVSAAKLPQPLVAIKTRAYSDAMPTTATDKYSFFTFVGPFVGGKWSFVLKSNDVKSEFGAATAFSAEIAVKLNCSKIEPGDKFVKLFGVRLLTPNSFKIKAQALGIIPDANTTPASSVANLSDWEIGGAEVGPVALNDLKRDYLERLSTARNGSILTTDLVLVADAPKMIAAQNTVATDCHSIGALLPDSDAIPRDLAEVMETDPVGEMLL